MKSRDTIKSNEKDNIRERSFGASPPVMKIQGGTMPTFGHQAHENTVWEQPIDTINVKTGYPENHMGKSRNVVPEKRK